ncbi:MAG: hypothetical protein ACAH95_03800 [Fimbriimonas sp.]
METVQTNTANAFSGWDVALMNTMAFLPKLLGFLVVLVIGWFVAKFLGNLVDKLLMKAGIDNAIAKSGIREALAKSGTRASAIAGKIVFFASFLFVLNVAFGMFGPNPISDLLTGIIAFIPNVVVAIALVVVSAQIAAFVRELINATLGGLSYGKMLANLAAFAIVVVGAFAALTQLKIAPEIVLGLYYAMLAIVVGVSVVAIGGSGIMALRPRWDTVLNKLDQEVPRVKDEIRMGQTMAQPSDRSGGYAA